MQISPIEEYSLRCLIQLARNQGGSPVTIRQISQSEGLSTAYVGKLLHHLQKSGLVQGIRGVQGGYRLVKPAEQLTLGEVFRAINPTAWSMVCEKYTGDLEACANAGHCGLQPVWNRLAERLYAYLDTITLSEAAREAAGGPAGWTEPTLSRAGAV
jgi:Rrf2 family protein